MMELLGLVSPRKYEDSFFTPETPQMFSVHTTPGKLKTQPPPAAEELECTLEPHDYQDDPIFENLSN